MTKFQVERLLELTHISYDRKFTEEEALEYGFLCGVLDLWENNRFSYISPEKIHIIRLALIPLITKGKLAFKDVFLTLHKTGYSKGILSLGFHYIMKEYVDKGKARRYNKYSYEILSV